MQGIYISSDKIMHDSDTFICHSNNQYISGYIYTVKLYTNI